MANTALRDAMIVAHVTEDELALACEVDPKTVARWLSDPGRVPHAQHRHVVCNKLGVEETVLWPATVRETIKTGPEREIVTVYPSRNMIPKLVWDRLIAGSTRCIVFAGYTNYFLWLDQRDLTSTLRRKAAHDCEIRFILGDPDSPITRRREEIENDPLTISTRIRITLEQLDKLRDIPHIGVRYSEEHISTSVFAFDNQMLVTPHLADQLGHHSPVFHLRRRQPNGLFDQFGFHVAALWDHGREAWQDDNSGVR